MFKKYIQNEKFYPSADNFTQALLVMLVTNIMSVDDENNKKEKEEEDNHEPASLGPRSLNGGTRFCYSFLTTTTFTLQRHKLFNILMVVLF